MPNILFIVTEDWYFYSHRKHLAKSAIEKGYKVALISNFSKHKALIEEIGIITYNWNLNRSSKNIFKEFGAIKTLFLHFKNFRPDLIHAVAIKPVLYSSIVCSLMQKKNRVFALAGLGFIFISEKKRVLILKYLMKFLLKLLLKGENTRLILQNPEDKRSILNARIIDENNICLSRGAGVDTKSFTKAPFPTGLPVVCLPSRMLWAKGISDFIECAKIINKNKKIGRFALVGQPDIKNPDSIPVIQLKNWHESGVIEWWGYQADMVTVYHRSTIVCLPTIYGEGLPKVLLESASCGRPIVSYDVPGCREIVKNNHNGFLVEPKNINSLVNSITKLLDDSKLCTEYGENGIKHVKKYFTQERIAEETISCWEGLLKK